MALTEPFDPNTLAALSITSSGTEDNDTIIAAIPTLNDGLSDGDALSDFSLSNVGKEVIPNCGGGLGSLNCLATKILYYINDQPMAYVKQIPVSSEQITLGDVKRELNMPNFKYFCMHFDQDYNTDVKSELINDYEPLLKTQAKTYVLHLKEREESIHSDPSTYQPRLAIRNGLVPGPAPNQGIFGSSDYNYRKGRIPDYSMNTTDSESCISSIKPVPNSYGFRPKYPVNGRYQGGNDSSRFDDYDQDTRCHSDDESRVSISTDLTSVSRQGLSRRRKKKRNYRQPSRASSDTSLGESSMCLDVITVVLNMDDGFLGISIVGNSNARGDNGIYVAAIIDKGAVALDGRIEQNDMILQVNDVSFENFTNDQAVNVLRDAVARKGMLKLTVAKSFNSGWRNGNCNRPNIREEPVEPIDTNEWIKHASRCCEFLKKENKIPGGMPSIQEGSEGAPTPVPGHKGNFYFGQGNGRQSGSQATSNDSDGAPSTIVGRNGNNGFGIMRSGMQKLSYTVDPKLIVQAMALPNSGLEIKERTWLKITIPDSFVGSDLVSWLLENVSGFKNRKDAKNFASELLQQKLITHYVNKPKFTEQCYYLFGESCRDYLRYRLMNGNNEREMVNECLYYPPPPPIPSGMGTLTHPNKGQQWQNYQGNSLVSGYAAMPISSYPGQGMMLPPRISNDMNSKVSGGTSNDGSSGSEHRRINQPAKAILPPAPSLNSIQNHYASTGILVANMNGMAHHRLDEMPPELSGSRQSFRFAMNSNDMNGEYYLRNDITMASRRRAVGVGAAHIKQQVQAKFDAKGQELASEQISNFSSQLESFTKKLEEFAYKHRNEIRKNSQFRRHFQEMCAHVGVDPLASSKGFWSSKLGVGDFYYELAVQVIEVCLSTNHINGGLITLNDLRTRLLKSRGKTRNENITNDDILRAVHKVKVLGSGFQLLPLDGGRFLIQSVPGELSMDHSRVLQLAEETAHVTVELIMDKLRWEENRSRQVVEHLVKEGLAWVDNQPSDTIQYWIPSLFLQQYYPAAGPSESTGSSLSSFPVV